MNIDIRIQLVDVSVKKLEEVKVESSNKALREQIFVGWSNKAKNIAKTQSHTGHPETNYQWRISCFLKETGYLIPAI